MDMTYYLDDCYVEAYAGRLNQEIAVRGDENEHLWIGFDHNFFDSSKFAGEGNTGIFSNTSRSIATVCFYKRMRRSV